MERRGFLRGLFGGITSAGLIIAAQPQDVAAFAAPLAENDPVLLDATPLAPIVACGDHLYNQRGEFVAVVTQFSDVFSGAIRMHADLVGALHVSKTGVRLRGKR